ncbi:F-box protein [Hirschfeldia incana]|nr:F-box protein [Hirschfeldia incana]
MDPPNPKRPRNDPSLTSPGFSQSSVDTTISSFLSLSDLPLFSSPLSISCSFDRVLDKAIIPTSTDASDHDHDRFLDRTLQLASLLYNSTKRCIRKRATVQNSISWPLLPELTTKVFSMLDTKSLMQASVCCTMFNKCAMDRVCYSHIDLTMAANNVDNGVVCIMIHRAGKELRSLKLGCVSRSISVLTRSCLAPLSFNHGFAGGLLRSLHLYNLVLMPGKTLSAVLSVCANLTDLKVLGFISGDKVNSVEHLAPITRNCRLIENLFLANYGASDPATCSTVVEFVNNCPNLSSLTLLQFGVIDEIARTIIMGFRQLKYINLSGTFGISGSFLRDLGVSCRDSPLQTLLLCDCYHLKEREVLLFLNSLLAGDFKSIRHIDISSKHGLVSDRGTATFEPKFPIEELKKQKPGLTFVAIFPAPSSSSSELYTESTSSSGSSYYSYGEDEEEEGDDVSV